MDLVDRCAGLHFSFMQFRQLRFTCRLSRAPAEEKKLARLVGGTELEDVAEKELKKKDARGHFHGILPSKQFCFGGAEGSMLQSNMI